MPENNHLQTRKGKDKIDALLLCFVVAIHSFVGIKIRLRRGFLIKGKKTDLRDRRRDVVPFLANCLQSLLTIGGKYNTHNVKAEKTKSNNFRDQKEIIHKIRQVLVAQQFQQKNNAFVVFLLIVERTFPALAAGIIFWKTNYLSVLVRTYISNSKLR